MAFWKKSDDPWDRKPEKRQETTWYEQDAPATEPVGADTIRPGKHAEEAEVCPWCGSPMLMGHIYGGRDGTMWREGERKSAFVALFDEVSPRQMRISGAAPSWYCEQCEKLVVTAAGLAVPVAEQRTSFHEYVDQWNAAEEKRKKKGE